MSIVVEAPINIGRYILTEAQLPPVIVVPPLPQPQPVPVSLPPLVNLRVPMGRGWFIWVLNDCEHGDPIQIANTARAGGVTDVFIKVAQELWNYNAAATDKLVSTIAALKASNVRVWGWGYVKLNSPLEEAAKAAERVHTLGLFGWVIDAEAECKGKPAQTKAYCTALRHLLTEPIGLCSYRFPLLHQEIAWAEFWKICDFDMPQVYWMGTAATASPGQQLAKSIGQLRSHGSPLPCYPVGVASPNDGDTWRPTLPQLVNFQQTAWDLGLPGTAWWSWQHARNVNPVWWETIAAFNWS